MNWKKVIQLTCVHVGVSMTVVPVTSTLNRIMIADMGLSATLVAVLVALPYLLSPLQVLVGDWTDRHQVWGRFRSPWIVIGGLMASFGSYLTAHGAYLMDHQVLPGLVVSVGTFLLWGIGVNVASVSYLSLVTDLTESEAGAGWRSRAVSTMWTAMILSTIGISLLLSMLLAPYTDMLTSDGETALYNAFGLVWMIASSLILIGAAGIEPRPTRAPSTGTARRPLDAFRLLSANPSARRFFVYLLLILISIHAQDVLLEPFGAEAFAMPVSQTSRLTAIWGLGFFITLIGSLPIMRRIGKRRTATAGAIVAATAFGAIIATGLIGAVGIFTAAVFGLGLGSGLMTVSNLSFMFDMTIPTAAGLYIGAWGVANFAGQALGSIASGLIRDTVPMLTGNIISGYVTVFGLEIFGLLVAIRLFRDVSVREFRRDAAVQLADVLAVELER